MLRSASSHSYRDKNKLPFHQNQLEKRKAQILTRNRLRNKTNNPITISAEKELRESMLKTPFRETGATLGAGFSHRIRSSITLGHRNPHLMQQPIKKMTLQSSHHKKIPLKLLNPGSDDGEPINLSEQKDHNGFQFEKRKTFLKKGTSINRSIMYNLLKNKCYGTVFDSSSSYTNYPTNQPLAMAVKQQLPKSLRDTIGSEETLRMSNIFTGGNIKSINLHLKANSIVKDYCLKPQFADDEEQITMKSIKRW